MQESEILEKVLVLRKRAEMEKGELTQLAAEIEGIKEAARSMEKAGISTPGAMAEMERAIKAGQEQAARAAAALKEYENTKAAALAIIAAINDPLAAEVVRRRYILGHSWQEIQAATNYGMTRLFTARRKALKEME